MDFGSVEDYGGKIKDVERTKNGVPKRYYAGLERANSRFDLMGKVEEVPEFEEVSEAKKYIKESLEGLPNHMYDNLEKGSFKISWGYDGAPEKSQEIYEEALYDVHYGLEEKRSELFKNYKVAHKTMIGAGLLGVGGAIYAGYNPVGSIFGGLFGLAGAKGGLDHVYRGKFDEVDDKMGKIKVLEQVYLDEPLTVEEMNELRDK